MRTRSGFVSNSSSSSFIVVRWSEVPEGTKDRIMDFRNTAISAWRALGIPVRELEFCIDFEKAREMGFSEETLDRLDFGWATEENCGLWRLKEYPRDDALEGTSSMDNFDFLKLLSFLGVGYRDLGENFGLFSDEEVDPKAVEMGLEFLRRLAESRQDSVRNAGGAGPEKVDG